MSTLLMMASPEIPSFLSIIQEVQTEATKIPGLHQYLSRRRFFTDLTIVALSVRTGYLLDLFAPGDPVKWFSRLLAALRINTKTKVFFARVFHLYEPHSEQSFFINANLLSERIHALPARPESPPEYPLFIHLQSSTKVTYEIPQQVLQVLVGLLPLAQSIELPLSFSLSDITLETVVPLAAILLDYLVAYVPCPSYPLSGVLLDVYECIFTISTHDSMANLEHSFIKFSCPTALREDSTQLKPDNMNLKLTAIFADRLGNAGVSGATIRVKHNSETVDRVVF